MIDIEKEEKINNKRDKKIKVIKEWTVSVKYTNKIMNNFNIKDCDNEKKIMLIYVQVQFCECIEWLRKKWN